MTSSSPTVLIASYLEPELVEQIRAAVPQVEVIYRPDLLGTPRYIADHNADPKRTPHQEAEWRALLAQAEILFDFDSTNYKDLPDLAPNVKWVQSTSAGIGQFVKRMEYDTRTNWIFTTASGTHARPLAEFVIASMLWFAKNFEYLHSEKAAKHWARYCATELAGKTLAIIGLGKIGRETALLAQFDWHIFDLWAYRDDVHLASWSGYPVTPFAWEALSMLWKNEWDTIEKLVEANDYREFNADEWGVFVAEAVKQGWIMANPDGTFTLTNTGKWVREAAEEKTDKTFYAPWSCLTAGDLAELRDLLSRLRDKFSAIAES